MRNTGSTDTQTKDRIWEAFYVLCETVPFHKLTVEQIVKQAGVSKATFYRHFMDKYDVLNYRATEVAERLLHWEECRSWQDFLLNMFREVEDKLDYYRRVFQISGQNAHTTFLFEYSYAVMKSMYLKSHGRTELNAEEHYMIAHYCHGCVGIMEDWLKDSDGLDAAQMAAVSYRAMPSTLKRTWHTQE